MSPRPRHRPSLRPSRQTWLRAAAVAVITGSLTLAAACSDEDTVDTVPPPWPTRTVTEPGPQSVPRSTADTATSGITSAPDPATATATATTP